MSRIRAGARRLAHECGYVFDTIACNLLAIFILAPVVVAIEALSYLNRLWNEVVEP